MDKRETSQETLTKIARIIFLGEVSDAQKIKFVKEILVDALTQATPVQHFSASDI